MNNEESKKCQCNEIMTNFSGRVDRSYLCLTGCPESEWAKEYNAMPWYKKLFYKSPDSIYNLHKRQTGTY